MSDFTYVGSREGTVYVPFPQDAFSRMIHGFTEATSMNTQLVTRALDQAISIRRRADAEFTAEGVIVHSDAGSQYTSLAFSQKLWDYGMNGSTGRVGTAYDNAVMEATIGLYKAWHGFNRQRLHSKLDYVSPELYEMQHHQNHGQLRLTN